MQKVTRHLQSNLVAYTALLFSLCGTSFAAASYINGKQIRPHSIPKNRLTSSAIKSLRGARGPQGPAGIAKVTSVLGPPALQCPVSGGLCKAATSVATCPEGSFVIGGGYRSTMVDNIIEVATRSGATTYTVQAVNHGTLNGAIIAEAICASGPGLLNTSVTRWGTHALATPSTSTSTTLAARVKTLEVKVATLKKREAKVEAKQACVRSYAGVTSQGNEVSSGYLFQTPTGAIGFQPALLHWPYANALYRLALVEPSCRWPGK
jgi:hypothetical protein